MHRIIESIQVHNFWISLALSTTAMILCARYAIIHPTSIKRPHYIAVAAMAGFYAISYTLFLTGVWDRLTWSENVLPVSTVSWIVVWITPVMTDDRIRKAGVKPEHRMSTDRADSGREGWWRRWLRSKK